MDERDVGADGARDLVERLVRRPDDDRVIAGAKHRVHGEEDGFFGAGERVDVVGVEPVVQLGDFVAQGGQPGDSV